MAIQPSSKSNLEQNQIALNQQIFAPASTENHNIELGNVKAGIVCECTSAANEDGLYSATVLNNLKSDGFAIYNGLIVTCRFSVANTVSSPKFSVNGIGAAPLRTSTTAVGSGCWKADAILQLQYCAFSNGDKFWLIVGSDSASEVDGVITNANGTTIYNKQTVDNIIKVVSKVVSVTVPSNTTLQSSFTYTPTSGYIPLGILGIYQGQIYMYLTSWRKTSNTRFDFGIRNISGASITTDVTFYILEQKL